MISHYFFFTHVKYFFWLVTYYPLYFTHVKLFFWSVAYFSLFPVIFRSYKILNSFVYLHINISLISYQRKTYLPLRTNFLTQLRRRSWCLTVIILVTTSCPRLLAPLAEASQRVRLLAGDTRLLVVTRMPPTLLSPLLGRHWAFRMANTLFVNLRDVGAGDVTW